MRLPPVILYNKDMPVSKLPVEDTEKLEKDEVGQWRLIHCFTTRQMINKNELQKDKDRIIKERDQQVANYQKMINRLDKLMAQLP